MEYQCGSCEFVDVDKKVVIDHLQQHESVEQQEQASAYAVSVCDQPPKTDRPDLLKTSDNAAWADQQTKLLIELYKTNKPIAEGGKIQTKKKMWDEIANEMQTFGCNYSAVQVENKWKSLVRSYKNSLQNKDKTGRCRKLCAYENELAEILGFQHFNNPTHTLENIITVEHNDEERESSRSNVSTPEIVTTSRRRGNSSFLKELQELRKAISRRTEKKEEIEKKKIEQRQEIIEQLKIKNAILRKILEKNK